VLRACRRHTSQRQDLGQFWTWRDKASSAVDPQATKVGSEANHVRAMQTTYLKALEDEKRTLLRQRGQLAKHSNAMVPTSSQLDKVAESSARERPLFAQQGTTSTTATVDHFTLTVDHINQVRLRMAAACSLQCFKDCCRCPSTLTATLGPPIFCRHAATTASSTRAPTQ
jgi:hypothetical protein